MALQPIYLEVKKKIFKLFDMVSYESCTSYISSATSIKEKIAKIDDIIDAMLDASLVAAESNGDIQAYELDTGQSRIKTTYKSMSELSLGIEKYRQLKDLYIAELQNRGGRVTRLMGSQNIRG